MMNFLEVEKDGKTLAINPSTLKAHEKAGWKFKREIPAKKEVKEEKPVTDEPEADLEPVPENSKKR